MVKNLKVGDSVKVAEPNADDLWNHSFKGTVKALHASHVTVEDGDGDCFDVDYDQVEEKDV